MLHAGESMAFVIIRTSNLISPGWEIMHFRYQVVIVELHWNCC